jgi:hypothetical protein
LTLFPRPPPKDDQSYCDDLWDDIEAKEAEIEAAKEKLKNDPHNMALILEVGRLEGELRELQFGLGQCGFNY